MLQKPVCFSLWLFKFGFYKQKLFNCHQCSVPQELTALGWTGSRDSNIYCFPAPRSLQGHSCCLVPTRMGRGEEYTVSQWALMETALLTRKVFYIFSPVLPWFFFAGAEGDATNGHLNLLVIYFCWCTTPPILSLSTHECSLCCCSLFSVMVVS